MFPQTVTDVTRQKDFLRAGIAREEVVTDKAGEPVMIGKGKRRRPKTRIVCEDADGRVIDLHAMRTTLGTNLARAGVAPQLAQRIMRHSDYRTTLKYYTVLGLTDTAKAIESLPTIDTPTTQSAKVIGTHDATAGDDPQQHPRQQSQQRARETARPSAATRDERANVIGSVDDGKSSNDARLRDKARSNATMCNTPAGVTQLVECQPSKLNVEGSSPFARLKSKPLQVHALQRFFRFIKA